MLQMVRIFTYLIGREAAFADNLKWMACANKGFFTQISTLADVQENVMEYLHVLSRPKVIDQEHDVVWTEAYIDSTHFPGLYIPFVPVTLASKAAENIVECNMYLWKVSGGPIDSIFQRLKLRSREIEDLACRDGIMSGSNGIQSWVIWVGVGLCFQTRGHMQTDEHTGQRLETNVPGLQPQARVGRGPSVWLIWLRVQGPAHIRELQDFLRSTGSARRAQHVKGSIQRCAGHGKSSDRADDPASRAVCHHLTVYSRKHQAFAHTLTTLSVTKAVCTENVLPYIASASSPDPLPDTSIQCCGQGCCSSRRRREIGARTCAGLFSAALSRTGCDCHRADLQPCGSRAFSVTSFSLSVQLADDQGLVLMTTVAMPVFSKQNETRSKGILLGVVGTDVPVKELLKTIPKYKLGIHGYAFAITNNGYILTHPELRPLYEEGKKRRKPNYSSVDLSEVEWEDRDDVLRNAMVNRKTGKFSMEVKKTVDKGKRVLVMTNDYYYTDIKGTPFSLGVALSRGHGKYFFRGNVTVEEGLHDLEHPDVSLADEWSYCNTDLHPEHRHLSQLEAIKLYLKGKEALLQCDKELIQEVLFDAVVSAPIEAYWTSLALNKSENSDKGVEVAFLGTRTGLSRINLFVGAEQLTNQDFLKAGDKENIFNADHFPLWYRRAAEQIPGSFVYSIPFSTGTVNKSNVVTASTSIQLLDERKSPVVAAVGIQMKLEFFQRKFWTASRQCASLDGKCSISCDDETVNCYLIDNNGFILVSEDYTQTGDFFGEVEGAVMNKLLTMGSFKRITLYDYQAMCRANKESSDGAHGLLDPYNAFLSAMKWIMTELVLFLVEFNLCSWWHSDMTAKGIEKEPRGECGSHQVPAGVVTWAFDIDGPPTYLKGRAFILIRCALVAITVILMSQSLIRMSALLLFCDIYLALTVSQAQKLKQTLEPCDTEYPAFVSERTIKETTGNIVCEDCSKSFVIQQIPSSNLFMVVVDSSCPCESMGPITMAPIEISQHNESLKCERLKAQKIRRRPESCHGFHPEENARECGGAPSLQAMRALLLSLLLILFSR
ncbi:Voltage-dependent calcium channel subunit alpha-2/delta-3 [Heterocephalus glaber]|uniref:Voltage-dependent calcium channel subunit alpha-2/delta-3 n=1 Tax=Heterocephalus glaber TaxID=10181 RepID=G5ATM1_HETGA|nr:Voltage-dependent calcium channel subunit alpha-2/delta-3 [Heterocephalus glaber]